MGLMKDKTTSKPKKISIVLSADDNLVKQLDFLKEVFNEKTRSKVLAKCIEHYYKRLVV